MNKTAGVKNYAFFFMKHDSIVVEILMIYIYFLFYFESSECVVL